MTTVGKSILILLLSLLAGCILHSKIHPVHLEGFVFRNHTSGQISSIEVRAPKTGEVAGCSNIPPGASCSNSLPLRKYQGNALTLSWSAGGKVTIIKDFVVPLPEKLVPGEPATAILTFADNGSFSAELTQGRDVTGHKP